MNENALLFEYAVVRYVPCIEREEFINVGLLMMCKRRQWFRSAFKLNAERLKALDPQVNLTLLENQLQMFATGSSALADKAVEERFRWFSALKSSAIQTSRPHPGLTDNLDNTFNSLFATLVL